MRISLITMEVDRRGKDGLICKDNLRADITVAFYLRVNETREDVLKVAKSIGVDRASDYAAVSSLFNAKFSEALKTVGKQTEFVKLFEDRQTFRNHIIEVIGNDLNGYILEDVAIDYLEQTPKHSLDADNIMDAEGIRKITELTANQNVITNELERNQELAIKKKNVETREAMLELERQQADAEARQQREIETIRAREQAESAKVQEEERLKIEQARIQTQQEIEIREENRLREVEVAQQNRHRAVIVEQERVERSKQLEIVAREREVELQGIEKEKALEEERKNIANVIRERIAVEKTVAQEEERIKEVREVSEAERLKQITILTAEAEAEQELVRQVKQADARVRMALAEAEEREGRVKALVLTEQMLAEAKGEQEQGLAQAKVLEAHASATEKQGLADARILEEKLAAQARGEEQLGFAKASATEKQGLADASVIRQQLLAEAEGLQEKFDALAKMSDATRQHEEFRLSLEKGLEESLTTIAANKDIAKEQAAVLASALSKANIEIVGGEGNYFENFTRSLSVGKAIEGVIGKSPVVQKAVNKLLDFNLNKKQPGLESVLQDPAVQSTLSQLLGNVTTGKAALPADSEAETELTTHQG
ncbi:MAG: hypothetical protein ACRC5A_14240 [Enterobacteriaceae bacterium]